MKSHRITFRLSPYQLARGLQTIRQLEPNYKLLSLNDLVKTIYHDWVGKMTVNKLDEIPYSIMEEVKAFTGQSAQKQITLEDLINIKTVPNSESTKSESTTTKPTTTTSTVSTVTDFSPPKDWRE